MKLFNRISLAIRIAICKWQASRIIARTKLQWPGCQDARNAWPTTGATGNGNADANYAASGTATTLLWGTKNFSSITGFLTITKISQKTIMAAEELLPNGDGATAGVVQLIDGTEWNIDVRDDTNQVTAALVVGQTIAIKDGGGLVPGGTRGQSYTAIIFGNDWETAPKSPAGRTLTVKKFLLI